MENLESWSVSQLLHYFGLRVLFSIICGGMIGIERQLKNKSAGIKTNILICLGSALYTTVSVLISVSFSNSGHYGDPARLAAQIVSGIGFLGGGAIIQSRGTISGLTTAATIWVVAAIGVCIGMGQFGMGVFCCITVVLVLIIATFIEEKFFSSRSYYNCSLVFDENLITGREKVSQLLYSFHLSLENFQAYSKNSQNVILIDYSGTHENNKKFILKIWKETWINEVRQG